MLLLTITILGAIAAGFVQGLTGFAFAMVSMSFWIWVLDPHVTTALVVFGSLAGQILSAFTIRRGFNLQLLWPYIAGGLIGIPIGVALLPALNIDWFKACVGLFLMIWCPAMLFSQKIPPITIKNRLMNSLIGLLNGFMSGAGGISGVLLSLWCTLCRYEKDTQRNIVQNFSLAMLLVTMGIYIYKGFVSRETIHLFAIVLPAMLVPSWLGARCYKLINPIRFRRMILILLTCSGLSMIASSFPKLLG